MAERREIVGAGKMTTIIMISHDSSVIINSGGDNEAPRRGRSSALAEGKRRPTQPPPTTTTTQQPTLEQEMRWRKKEADDDDTSSSLSSCTPAASPDMSSSGECTPDCSFLTPRPLVPEESSSSSSMKKVENEVTPQVEVAAAAGVRQRRYKNSVSTQESDSEEPNNSSSSAASTLSSGNSLPVGASSDGGGGGGHRRRTMVPRRLLLSSLDDFSLSYSSSTASSSGEKQEQRGRHSEQPFGSKQAASRTQSFCSRPSSSPCLSTKEIRLQQPRRPPSQQRQQQQRAMPPAKPERSARAATRSSYKTSSPCNGPHGLKFFVNPSSGKMDLKGAAPRPSASPSVARASINKCSDERGKRSPASNSLDRGGRHQERLADQQRPAASLNRGREASSSYRAISERSSGEEELEGGEHRPGTAAINTVGLPAIPNYCTLTRRQRGQQQQQQRRRLLPPPHFPPTSSFRGNAAGCRHQPPRPSQEETISLICDASLMNPAARIRAEDEDSTSSSNLKEANGAAEMSREEGEPPSFSIYSDMNDFQALLPTPKIEKRSAAAAAPKEEEKSRGSRLTKKPSLRDSSALAPFWDEEDSEDGMVVVDTTRVGNLEDGHDSDEDTDSSELSTELVGKVASTSTMSILPTGCHRHPKHLSLPPVAALREAGEYGGAGDYDYEDDRYLSSLLSDLPWTPAMASATAPPARGAEVTSSSGLSRSMWEGLATRPESPVRVVKRRRVKARAPDIPDAAAAKTSGRSSSGGRISLQSRLRLMSGLNLAGGRILRRHTTYVKGSSTADLPSSSSSAMTTAESTSVHVHSWHRSNNNNGRKKKVSRS